MQCLFALSEAQRSRRCGEKHMSETVTGYIDHVIFRNEDNGYTVMVLKGTKKEEELTCVGSFPAITQGASIEATGVYIHHPVYGKQFQISSFTEKMPEDTYGIERYLGSGAIRGIGAALAARIVRKFGDDTLRIVEEEPERLVEVKGISEKKAREIAAQVSEKAEMRKVMIFLQKYGISLNLGAKIYQKYKESVYTILQENPYRLAEDISGVGFKIADEIAARVGIHADSDYRIRSGMLYTLLQASGEGHTYLPREQLFTRCARLLGVDESYMEKHLMDMVIDRKLVLKEKSGETIVYPAQYYYLELNTARMLNELNIVCPEDKELVRHRIELIEKETGTVLDEMQKKAITEAADHGLFILTGGPGTGKTTTINAIIRFFEGEGAEIRLAAPTGRAAKRMTETTGYEAQTIHRLLELNGMPEEERDGHSAKFERNAQNPLEADVVIIDTAAGIADAVLEFLVASGEILLVTTPEPTSITDSYSLLKALSGHPRFSGQATQVKMIANKVGSKEEGKMLYDKLNVVVSRYLQVPFSYLGAVPQDPELSKAVMRQMPVSMQAPSSRAAQAYEELAAKLLNKEAEQSVAKRGMAAFFSHMISGKR